MLLAASSVRAGECSPEDAERFIDALVEVGGLGRTDVLGLDGGLQLDEAALREAAVLLGCDLVEDLGATVDALDRALWAGEGRGFDRAAVSGVPREASAWWRVLLPRVRLDFGLVWDEADLRTGSRRERIRAGVALWIVWSLARWGD
jgi:hypothetical protein